MKIKVQRSDSSIETLNLIGNVTVREGSPGGMSTISLTDIGCTHFFLNDGTYDGWEMDVSGAGMAIEDVQGFVEAVEADREIEPR